MKEIILLWQAKDKLHQYKLEPGKTYYIGRPTMETLQRHPDLSPFGVYIIPEDPDEKPHYTGYDTTLVSRLDTRITITRRGDKIKIKNHGPKGTGAKNPTIINNQILAPGEEKEITLNDTGNISLELTSQGPTFTIAVREQEKTKIRLETGTPITLPKTLAEQLVKRGLVEEAVDLGDTMEIVIKPEAGDSLLVELLSELLGTLRIVKTSMEKIAQQPSMEKQREKEKQGLQRIDMILSDIYMSLDRDPGQAQIQFQRLEKIKEYGELIENLGERAKTIYESLRMLMHWSVQSHKEEIKQQIILLREIIKEKIQLQ